MGRRSVRRERRREIVGAFARVLADHGYAGATIAAVAAEAGVAPGLIHHHFDGKRDMLRELLQVLLETFRRRVDAAEEQADPLEAYIDAALRLDASSDTVAARCWVGLFSEAVRDTELFDAMRRLLDREVTSIRRRSGDTLDVHEASSVLAFIIGALVFGAFAPRKTAGFAAPGLRRLVESLGQA